MQYQQTLDVSMVMFIHLGGRELLVVISLLVDDHITHVGSQLHLSAEALKLRFISFLHTSLIMDYVQDYLIS